MLKIKFDDAAKSRKLRPTRTKKNDAGDAWWSPHQFYLALVIYYCTSCQLRFASCQLWVGEIRMPVDEIKMPVEIIFSFLSVSPISSGRKGLSFHLFSLSSHLGPVLVNLSHSFITVFATIDKLFYLNALFLLEKLV